MIDPCSCCPVYTERSVSQVGFERMTTVIERAKTVHALNHAATVIGVI
jgi:hypothetical protein